MLNSQVSTERIQFENESFNIAKLKVFLTLIVLALFFGSIVFVNITRQVRLGLAHDQLVDNLKSGTPTGQQRALESYQANLAMGTSISSLANLFSSNVEKEKQIALTNLYAIINKIELNDFNNASLLFRDAVKPNIKSILSAMPFDQLDHNLFRTVMKQSESWIANVSELAQLEVQAPSALKRDKTKIKEQSVLALDLINSFAEFLGLPAISDLAGTNLTFYKSGVLKGLPMLAQIPDDLKDLKELKNVLDQQGAKVAVQGENAPQEFEKKLGELRSSSAIFREQIEALSSNITNIKTNRDKLRLEVYQSALAVRSDLIQLLEIISKPKMSFVADVIYALLTDKVG